MLCDVTTSLKTDKMHDAGFSLESGETSADRNTIHFLYFHPFDYRLNVDNIPVVGGKMHVVYLKVCNVHGPHCDLQRAQADQADMQSIKEFKFL